MFEKELTKYKFKGEFSFKTNDLLEEKCNAPTDNGGVYLIYKMINSKMELLYIGSSGQKRDGKLKVRQSGLGGMKDRLVNGYHPKFGKIKRKKVFPIKMRDENISELKIFWWITYDKVCSDFPTDVESALRNIYLNRFRKLPDWHK